MTKAWPVLSAPQISVVGSTTTPVEGGVPMSCAWGGGVGVRCGGMFILPGKQLDLHLVPACSQSPYELLPVVPSNEWGHRATSWPTLPHWKHRPTSLSYLYATPTYSPSELMIWPPLRISLLIGTSTQIHWKQAWSAASALQSTSTIDPIPYSMSNPASSLIRSNGKPHTWTHTDKHLKLTILTVRPFSHLCKATILLSKLHEPLLWSISIYISPQKFTNIQEILT